MQSSVDKMFLNTINNFNKNVLNESKHNKFNLINTEIYPDPYSHMTVTCLEYPEAETKKKAIEASSSPQQKEMQSRAKLSAAKKRLNRRNNVRYMTQPVTLIEIKETEEDSLTLFPSNIHSKPSFSKEN